MNPRSPFLILLAAFPTPGLGQVCVTPDTASRPSFLAPGLTWEQSLSVGSITFESPSPKGPRVTQVTPGQYAGTYAFLAQVTNGRLAPLALVGRLTLYQPPAPIQRPFKLQICRGSTCRDSSGTRSDSFPLIGHTDAAANQWPVYADKPSDTQDSKAPGVEAILTPDSLLEFSLGPGVNAEDGPPRFTITEVTSTGFAGWWYEGAPIVNPSGGYFCLVREP